MNNRPSRHLFAWKPRFSKKKRAYVVGEMPTKFRPVDEGKTLSIIITPSKAIWMLLLNHKAFSTYKKV